MIRPSTVGGRPPRAEGSRSSWPSRCSGPVRGTPTCGGKRRRSAITALPRLRARRVGRGPALHGGDADDGDYGDWDRLHGVAQHFCAMFNVQRVLGDQIDGVIDAVSPGGSGDPFAGLGTHQREELANLYRLGYPRGTRPSSPSRPERSGYGPRWPTGSRGSTPSTGRRSGPSPATWASTSPGWSKAI